MSALLEAEPIAVVDPIEHLDFEPSCSWSKCESGAHWVVVYSCCGEMRFWCTSHLKQSQGPASRDGWPAPWNCLCCKFKTKPGEPFPLASVTLL